MITFAMSVICVVRSIVGLIRCERSPRPVSVGVNTLCPLAVRRSATRRQHQPPCQAPCTRTKVLLAGIMRDPRTFHENHGECCQAYPCCKRLSTLPEMPYLAAKI